jgi:hypothetical protein
MRRASVPRAHCARRHGGRQTGRPVPVTLARARGRVVVGFTFQRPVSRANGWPGHPKPPGVSRMAQTQSHYRPSPPLLQGAEHDLEVPSQGV